MQSYAQEKIYDILIIGAGPIGIEAAVVATQNGLDTLVLEQGAHIGYHAQKFSHLGMFSPWYYNYSPYGVSVLKKADRFIYPQSSYDTTQSYLHNYLIPLAQSAQLTFSFNTKVLTIGKRKFAKTSLVNENRKKQAFRVLSLVDSKEQFFYAQRVIDASGIYTTPLFAGYGRVPAINEQLYRSSLFYQAIDNENSQYFQAKTTLLLGQICCTAKSLNIIQKYISLDSKTKLIYVDETGLKPYISQLKDDIFERRVQSIRIANEFLDSNHPQVEILEKSGINKIEKNGDGFDVTLFSHKKNAFYTLYVDTIVSNCGFAPDSSLYSELQVHECYSSNAPMNLASAMYDNTQDHRLTPSALEYETLTNPEPNFYILGSKSYGRNQGFSLHIGIGQIVELFAHILKQPKEKFLQSPLSEHKDLPFITMRNERISTQSTPLPTKIKADKDQMYKTIANNLQEVVFQTDLKQKITYLSPSWEALTGFSSQDFIGLDWQALLHKDSQARGLRQCNAFMSNKLNIYKEEYKILCHDSSVKWVEVNASILVDANNVAYATIGSMVNITQRVLALDELQKKNKLLDRLATIDELTDVYNRRYFNDTFQRDYEQALQTQENLCFIICDIDFFKPYNDYYGHQQGDKALHLVAQSLQKTFCNTHDTVARYGGEEFVIVLPQTSQEDATKVVQKAREAIRDLNIPHAQSRSGEILTLSFGMASTQIAQGKSPDNFVGLADQALYKSKKNGRDRLTIHTR